MKFGHIAGDRFLDLVNTVDWRKSDEQRHERLDSFVDVVDWCEESEVITGSEADQLREGAASDATEAERQLGRVIVAREHAYRALFLRDAAAAAALGEMLSEALGRAHLQLGEHGWAWCENHADALTMPADRIVRGLVALGERDDLDRLHQCEDVACGWVYLDTSPRRNRRWCATSDCGDRNRARAYYARKKGASPATRERSASPPGS